MEESSKILGFAAKAGHILLQNGAEISRVEETMDIISNHYGAQRADFFVLSNGIFTTGDSYSFVEYIPIKGSQLDKVVEVNDLSRQIVETDMPLCEAEKKLEAIEKKGSKPLWEMMLSSIIGCAAFCIVFGGGLSDALGSAIADVFLYGFYLFLGSRFLSKPLANIFGGFIGTVACILLYHMGIGHSLGHMVIGTVISLIPGVAFINGLRDIINEDYLAGTTRLLDAMLLFFCIAMGVCLSFIVDGWVSGAVTVISSMAADAFTSRLGVQLVAAFLGTSAFACLFGVPRRYYLATGLVGMLGWFVYLLISRYLPALSFLGAIFFAALCVAYLSKLFAMWKKCPNTVFLICGIFPLIPGAGVFWSSYYVVTEQFGMALRSGFNAVASTVAIVLALMVFSDLFNRRGHSSRQA